MNPAALAEKLERQSPLAATLPIIVGFDGFVDEIIRVVGTRTSPEVYSAVATIAEFGAWISASAGRSGLREFVTLDRTAGGCAVNSGDGLASLGFPVNAYIGMGIPPDSVFKDFSSKCRAINPLPVEPGRSLVYEFQDGKLIMCSVGNFSRLTPGYVAQLIGDGNYRKACESAAGIALTSWSVYPHMTECWDYLQHEVYSHLTHRPRLFLDLADPANRSAGDLLSMISTLAGFEKIGPTTLSLNGNEANRIAKVLGFAEANHDPGGLEYLASKIRERAQISEVGIHLIRSATGATANEAVTVHGPFCRIPQKSVGAGDRFNAGWLAGSLLGLSEEERLLLGVAVSGFFVRAARSGSFSEIISFLRHWANGALDAEDNQFSSSNHS